MKLSEMERCITDRLRTLYKRLEYAKRNSNNLAIDRNEVRICEVERLAQDLGIFDFEEIDVIEADILDDVREDLIEGRTE